MDPLTMYLLGSGISGGLGFLGNLFGANAQNNQAQLNAQEVQQQRGDTMSQQVAQFLMGQQQLQNQQAMQGLQSTQMDPYTQARALGKAQLASQINPNGVGFSSLSTGAMNPGNLSATKTNFDNYVGAASPNVPIAANDPSAAAFQQKYQGQQQDLQNQILAYLRNIGQYSGQNPATIYGNASPITAVGTLNPTRASQPPTRTSIF